MISLSVKIMSLTALAEPLLKSEILGLRLCTAFQRTLYTRSVLLTRSIYKKKLNEENFRVSEPEKTYGQIIELQDFDEVREHEVKKTRRKKKYKSNNLTVDVNLESNQKTFQPKGQTQESHSEISDADAKIKLSFKILNEKSGLLSSLMTELKSKKFREEKKQILVEGKRLINDAVSAGLKPIKIFFSRTSDLEKLNLPEEVEIFRAPYKSLKVWSDVVMPQGVIGIFQMPKISAPKDNANTLPLIIVCDNVRDPGNLGSMLRVVAGVGCKKMILTKGCTDIWDPKVLRSGAGAHFRLPVINNLLWSDIEQEISESSKILLADFSNCSNTFKTEDVQKNNLNAFRRKSEFSENLPMHCYYSLKYGDENTVIIIGGETYGLSDEAYKFALEKRGSRIFIPMSNKIESLNNSVALGVLAYEFRRQFDFIRESRLSAVNSE